MPLVLTTSKDVLDTISCLCTAVRSIRPTEGRPHPTTSACNPPCLTLVQVAVLSDAAKKSVFREGHVGHLFQKSNAHNSWAFNASLVRHEPGVEDTHSPRVENSSPRGPCLIDGGGQPYRRARTLDQDFVQPNMFKFFKGFIVASAMTRGRRVTDVIDY